MKKFYRWLSVLVCACMLCTSLPGDLLLAIAEEAEPAVEETLTPGDADPAAQELEQELGGEPAEGGDAKNEAPSNQDAAGFAYAKIVADAPLYAEFDALNAERATLLSGGIVLAVDRRTDGLDRVKVVFAYDGVAESGWVDASALSALTQDETAAFFSGVTEALCYQDDVSWPLPVPSVKLPEPQDPQTPGEADQTPEKSENSDENGVEGETEEPLEPAGDDAVPSDGPNAAVEPERELEVELTVPQQGNEWTAETGSDAETDLVTMTLPVSEAQLIVGETTSIRADFSDGVDRALRFALSASGVVSVDADGVVTAIGAGSADVQVICEELGLKETFSVTVAEAQPAFYDAAGASQENLDPMQLIVGETKRLTSMDGAVRYASDNDKVAAVDESGAVTAVGAGNCTITAFAQDGASAQCAVTVYALPEKLEATLAGDLDVGGTADVALNLDSYVLSKVTYASSNDQVATVSQEGRVTAVGRGVCDIKLTLGALTQSLSLTVYGAPETFDVTVSKDKLMVGETGQISIVYPEYTRATAKYASANEQIATVDAQGVVTAVGKGKCEIRVTVGNLLKTVDVESWAKPENFTVNLEKSVIPVGYFTEASVDFPEYTTANIVYSSQNTDVALVDEETGLIYAVAEGECLIAATADNGVCVTRKLTVVTTGVELVDKYLILAVGEKYELEYSFNDTSLGFIGKTFSSSNSSVAAVDANTGVVTAVGEGEATITLTLENGEKAECYMAVLPAPTRITLVNPPTVLGVGQITNPVEFELYAGNEMTTGTASIKTSNSKVVQVNAYGQMKGVKAGTATITLTSYNGRSVSFKVTVKAAPKSLTVSPAKASLAVGQQGQITYTLTKNTAAGVTFTSSNPDVATVDQSGRVTAVGEGVCVIEVKTHNNLRKNCTITVNPAPENVTLKLSSDKLGVGMTATAAASVDTSSNIRFTYEYWTDHPEIISVDASTGKVTALAMGEANVYVKTYNGVTSHEEDGKRVQTAAKVKVVPAPEVLDVDGTTFNVIVGYTINLPVVMRMKDGSTDCMTTYTLSTSSAKIAKVSGTQVKAVKAGTATITVQTANGLTKQVKVIVRAKPTKVLLEYNKMNLGEGMTAQLRAKVFYSSKSCFMFSAADAQGTGAFTSSDPSIVAVDAAGNLTGVKKGTATITFKTLNGKSAKCQVTVLAKPTEIHISPKEVKLGVGMTSTLKATFGLFELGQPVYTTSDEKVATVDASGKITAVAQGEATITATVEGTITDTCKVKVVPAPEVLDVDGTTFNVIVGNTIDLPILMRMKDGGTDCMTTYTLSTSSAKIAKIVSGTQVKAVKAGTATITVQTANGLTKQVKVIVRAKPTKVLLEHSSMDLGEGMTAQLRVKVFYSSKSYFLFTKADAQGTGAFTSSDPSIVTVDEAGNLTGVKKGIATITFKTLNGKSAKCQVTVLAKPTEIHISPKEAKLGVGMTSTLKATFGPFELGQPVYTTSDEKVATVDASGKITAVAQGEATVTATVEGTITDTCKVKVVPAPEAVRFDGTEFNVVVGTTIVPPVVMSMKDGGTDCMTTYSLSSSNAKIAKIVSGTQVKAVKAGTATITVKTANGLTASVRLVVRAKPTKVLLEHSSMNLGEGMTALLRAKVYYSSKSYFLYSEEDSYGTATFTSSDPSIVTVDAAGNLTGVKKGEAIITFKTVNGKSAQCRVTVLAKPTAIYLEDEEITLGWGMTAPVKVTFNPYELGELGYSCEDPSIATVDASGKITAVGVGETVLHVTCNGLSAQCKVTVMDAPRAVKLNITSSNMAIGGKLTLVPTCVFDGEKEGMASLTFMSSNTSIATVDQNGLVKGVKAGSATIRVQAQNGVYADCKIVVRKAPTKVVLSSSDVRFGAGQSQILKGTVYYSGGSCSVTSADSTYVRVIIEDTSIASYDPETGKVTGHEVGKTRYRLVTYNKKYSAYGWIVIQPGAEWIAFAESMVNLGVDQSKTVLCDKSAGSVVSCTYVSSNPGVAEVQGSDDRCTIVAKSAGTATITATSSNGKTATCEVVVMAKPESVSFARSTLSVGANETVRLPAVSVTSTKGECIPSVTYASSNVGVATVDSSGYVHGVKAGTAVITVKTYNGLSDTCTVTVKPEPTRVSVTAQSTTLAVGDSTQLNVEMDTAGAYAFSVDDADILKIDADGKATALAVGNVVVTVETYNGCKATCALTVKKAPQSVALNVSALTLGVGMTQSVSAAIDADSYGVLNYASTDETIVVVDESGKVTAKGAGTAEIRASVAGRENVFDTCTVEVLPMATKVVLNRETLTLRKGASAALDASLTNDQGEACYGEPEYITSDATVAAVGQDGRITGLKAGEAVITVKAPGTQVQAACKVTVVESNVALDVQQLCLGVGETYSLTLTLPAGATGAKLASSSAAVATVTSNGRVTAVAEGEAVITLSYGNETAQCTVTVGKKPESIQLSAAQKRLAVGKTYRLGATLLPEGAASQLQYATSDNTVATVAEDGTITAVGYGSATITVSSYAQGVSAQCAVDVVYAPEMIRFGELDDIVVSVGDTYALKTPVMFHQGGDCDASYTLSISNSTCARIAMENGRYVIRGLKEGSATLRLKTDNGKTATHSVYVAAAPRSMAFEDPSIRMGVGETYQPAVKGDNEAQMRVTLQSSNSQVVRVEDGKLCAVSEGTATITATAELNSGLKAQMTVQVVKAPQTMRLSETSLTLAVGEGFALEPVFDGDAGSASVRFTSDNESVLYADDQGYVYAVSVGQAKVTAVTYNGLKASCTVTVKSAPTAISVRPAQITACLRDEVRLEVSFGGDDEFANVLYESGNPAVAQVSDDGLVTFKSLGTTVISVEAFNGMSVEVPVTVSETPSTVAFGQSTAVILTGDRAQLPVKFDKGAAYYTLTSSDPSILRIAADGCVEALKPGKVTVTLQVPSMMLSASCAVDVVAELEGVVLKADKTTLQLHETAQLTYQLLPANAIGTGLVRFSCGNTDVATVDAQTGVVTGEAYGAATLYATSGDGKIGECTVNVLGGKRRMLSAYYYGEEGDAGYLPFSFNNGYSMADAFRSSTVEGQTYSVCGPMSNAPKSELFGAIDSHFADATDDDVSIIYICAHGYAAGPTGDYAFGLDPTHYVTGSELMNHLEKIKGRVVLIMDSCHAGGVIDCNKSRLDAQGGRISILASSHANTSSSYWIDSRKFTSVDFYTCAILRGLGYNEADGLGGYAHGWTLPVPYADTDKNGDVTVSELFAFAYEQTRALVSTNAGKKQFAGHPQQTPQSYIGSMNEDLVLFSK